MARSTAVAQRQAEGHLRALGDLDVLGYMERHSIDASYLRAIKRQTGYKEADIADWLDISPRTMRSYKGSKKALKKKLAEQVVMLRTLFEKGHAVLGSAEAFDQWLGMANFFFDGKKPIQLLDTTSGLRFIYDRLVAMEYGDNV
jgi:uncharacterized protein (DUF2384 family)